MSLKHLALDKWKRHKVCDEQRSWLSNKKKQNNKKKGMKKVKRRKKQQANNFFGK